MENEDRLFARFVNFWRDGYREYARFIWVFYGGEAAAKAAQPAPRIRRKDLEKAP
jgi:hypothetical protein